ncbi:hypothetical protein [uncultured Treponema sp.]|uniref:hypothetical protein n=1 Tax=uncultured Treponema sp. TaxID=162155 RepID=UPI0025EF6903|nr:hypothetical protein [uncultured Treponema sp.]
MQDKEKLIAELEELLEKQRKIDELELSLKKEKERKEYLLGLSGSSLFEFDMAHKQNYILQNAGPEPIKPWIFGKDEWRIKYERWQKDCDYYEKQYYTQFESQRNELRLDVIQKNREETDLKINELIEEIDAAKKYAYSGSIKLDSKTQTSENILAIIDILKTPRADNLKEAINILLTEQFQNRMNDSIKKINQRLNELEQRVKSNYKELKNSIKETDDWVSELDNRISDLEEEDDDEEED